MRLIDYLTEDEGDAEIKIEKECKPWLTASKGYDVYRGMWGKKDFDKIKVRKDRRPLDTPLDVHNELDNIFKKHFGWKARSGGLLATGDRRVAGTYGEAYKIFPIGRFRFIWSNKVHDLYGRYVEFMTKEGLIYSGGGKWKINQERKDVIIAGEEDLSMDRIGEFQGRVFKKLDDLIKKEYSSSNLINAIKSNNEIMIDCKEYYAISMLYD